MNTKKLKIGDKVRATKGRFTNSIGEIQQTADNEVYVSFNRGQAYLYKHLEFPLTYTDGAWFRNQDVEPLEEEIAKLFRS